MFNTLESYYSVHAPVYDLTRWAFLFGRIRLKDHFPELNDHPAILDLGCGTGQLLPDLLTAYPDGKIIALDRSADMIIRARDKVPQGVDFRNQVYDEDSFSENAFDLIICSYSLTMMEDQQKQLKAIRKHLKPNGIFIVLDFDQSPFPLFNSWMRKNFVDMSNDMFDQLRQSFSEKKFMSLPAYLGLWHYSLFIGECV